MTQLALVADRVREADNIVAFTGAGISTPSGIPDFRSEDSGLWENVDPHLVASIFGFRKNPAAFYNWVRPLTRQTRDAQPNPAHDALVTLEKMGKLRAVITQNIDMLHSKAGSETVFELHGHMRTATCIQCFKVYDGKPIIDRILVSDDVPRCAECNGVLKPDVILFGEQLPYEQMMGAKKAARNTDLIIVIGSSLEVAPASDIPLIAKRNGAKLIIVNNEPTIMDRFADQVVIGDCAVVLPEIIRCVQQPTQSE